MNKNKIFIGLVLFVLFAVFVTAWKNVDKDPAVAELKLMESDVSGLENAMLRVRNEEQKHFLEKVMNRVQEKHRLRLNALDNVSFGVDKDFVVEAEGVKEDKLFGLFKAKHRIKYAVTDDGDLVRRKNFFDFFWKEIKTGETE